MEEKTENTDVKKTETPVVAEISEGCIRFTHADIKVSLGKGKEDVNGK